MGVHTMELRQLCWIRWYHPLPCSRPKIMPRAHLKRDVAIRVRYNDVTSFGSPTTQRPEESIRSLFGPLFDYANGNKFDELIRSAPRLLQAVVEEAGFAQVCERQATPDWRIRPEVLFPDPALAVPRWLAFFREIDDEGLEASLPMDAWAQAHDLVAQLIGTGHDLDDPSLDPEMRRLLMSLMERGLVEEDMVAERYDEPVATLAESDLTFIGHNTVAVRSGDTCVIIDPFFFPHSSSFPSSYQPLGPRELGLAQAILITHSHPDHFDPASLLQLPRDTRIIVPQVARESLLSIDMLRRSRELGFRKCETLPWHASTVVGDIEIHSLPFYGEQPTDSLTLHPDVRNVGNTYVVRTPRFSLALVSDTGRDGAGDMKDVAAQWHWKNGPVDVVLSGYRGWITYPVQLLFSSVSRYILFVPPCLWDARFRLMNDVDDAVDVAERWGARYFIPYGDGGAPWHWSIGLGPNLETKGMEHPDFDPFPERAMQAARCRVRREGSTCGSAVETLLLRPGDSIQGLPRSANVMRVPGYAWSFGETFATGRE